MLPCGYDPRVGWGVLYPTDKKNEIHLKIARAEIKWLVDPEKHYLFVNAGDWATKPIPHEAYQALLCGVGSWEELNQAGPVKWSDLLKLGLPSGV